LSYGEDEGQTIDTLPIHLHRMTKTRKALLTKRKTLNSGACLKA